MGFYITPNIHTYDTAAKAYCLYISYVRSERCPFLPNVNNGC